MYIKNWKKEIFSIPNVLSMIRLALIHCGRINSKNNMRMFSWAMPRWTEPQKPQGQSTQQVKHADGKGGFSSTRIDGSF